MRVFGINPSATRTERTLSRFVEAGSLEKACVGLPFGRLMEADEVAQLAVFGCSPLSGYLSGTVINLDGGQQYATPKSRVFVVDTF